MISVVKLLKLSFLMCSLLLAGCFFKKEEEIKIHTLQGDIFGAYYIIKYRGDLNPEDFQKELDKFFEEFNLEFSTYRPDSVVSAFNQAPANKLIKVSPRFIQMLKLAQKFYEDTHGAFDPTLGPVIKLWGFGGGATKRIPTEEELKKAQDLVGFDSVKWDEKNQTIWKTKNALQLDLNAIAPGWVCDLIGETLISKGIENYMVDLSGEIYFKGNKGPDSPWIAGIEKPANDPKKSVHLAFKIKDMALATSGNYRQFFDANGERKSHIIDPRTFRPVTHSISSASVLADTGIASDIWSTALMVLGEEGIELAEKNGIKVLLLQAKKENLFIEILSPSMERFLKSNQL